MAYIIDASVILKWFIPEEHSERALRLKDSDARLHAPVFLTLEVGNVLSKKRRRGELTAQDAEDIWRAFRRAPIRRHADETLVLAAFDLAHHTRQSLYDSLYLALAMQLNLTFLTADRKFYQALQHSEYHSRLLWIEDFS
ncbi:MAG: type II toxin-antitoxin system VapC family toxin [Nitrospira sp.]|nr:type II toxin-antitoxin system VapC family toxin [Nitrospira sp.]